MMKNYAESLWQKQVDNEAQLNGEMISPEVKMMSIALPKKITREEEVLAMSMFYPNNLLNSFLHRLGHALVSTPMCICQEERQTAYHIVMECGMVKKEYHDQMKKLVSEVTDNQDHMMFINHSRSRAFMDTLVKIVATPALALRRKIVLPKRKAEIDPSEVPPKKDGGAALGDA